MVIYGWEPYQSVKNFAVSQGLVSPGSAEQRQVLEIQSALPTDVDVAFFGDSHVVRGYWNERFPGRRISVRGVGGETSGRALDRLREMERAHPKTAIIQTGTNDVALGLPADDVLETIEKIGEIFEGRGAQVVLTTLPACAESCNVKAFNSINSGIVEVAMKNGWEVTNLKNAFAGNVVGYLGEDMVHLNSKGYAAWADAIFLQGLRGLSEAP